MLGEVLCFPFLVFTHGQGNERLVAGVRDKVHARNLAIEKHRFFDCPKIECLLWPLNHEECDKQLNQVWDMYFPSSADVDGKCRYGAAIL